MKIWDAGFYKSKNKKLHARIYFLKKLSENLITFYALHRMMQGAYSFLVFHTWVCGYECTSFCTNVCICMYIRDPVRRRLRHLYQVEFCCFIVRYPTAGASVYCGHISSFFFGLIFFGCILFGFLGKIFSRRHLKMFFLILPEHRIWHFRQFAWNVKYCLLGK